MKNLAFHSLLRWKMIILQFSLHNLYLLFERVGRMYLLNLGVKGFISNNRFYGTPWSTIVNFWMGKSRSNVQKYLAWDAGSVRRGFHKKKTVKKMFSCQTFCCFSVRRVRLWSLQANVTQAECSALRRAVCLFVCLFFSGWRTPSTTCTRMPCWQWSFRWTPTLLLLKVQ